MLVSKKQSRHFQANLSLLGNFNLDMLDEHILVFSEKPRHYKVKMSYWLTQFYDTIG